MEVSVDVEFLEIGFEPVERKLVPLAEAIVVRGVLLNSIVGEVDEFVGYILGT